MADVAPPPSTTAAEPERPVSLTTDELAAQLRPILVQALQAHGGQPASSSEADTEALLTSLKGYLRMHVLSSQGVEGAGMALPDVDEQLLPLQQQVEAVMQSVASHRASVPAVISKALEQQMQQMRPGGGADDAAPAADQHTAAAAGGSSADAAAGADAGDAAAAGQLHEALQAAINKLPALRARLEEMDERLQRNLAAVDASQGNATHTPRTVERVLRSVAGGSGGAAAAALGAETPATAARAAVDDGDDASEGGEDRDGDTTGDL